MTIIHAPWLFDGTDIHRDMAVAYAREIEAIAPFEVLQSRYPDAETIHLDTDRLLMPGLVNPHVHLEFGTHTTQLHYGDFMPWLQSVIQKRDTLIDACRAGCYKRQIDAMLQSGITAFGAISSYGKDLAACRAAPQRVLFFNEAIGSRPDAVDALYSDFMQRYETSAATQNDRFKAGIAIHSPYSVHPVLMRKILSEIPDAPLTAHFMESPAERMWLEEGEGPLKAFFENFLGQSRPLQRPEHFLASLDRPALLTHAVQADDPLLKTIADAGHSIIHAPRSNRLLGCGRLAVEKLNEKAIPWFVGTDGLSSNTTLNLWDEMRAALMLHHLGPLEKLARKLLRGSTADAAEALKLPAGRIEPKYSADLVVVSLPDMPEQADQIPLQAILHTDRAEIVIIQGERHV